MSLLEKKQKKTQKQKQKQKQKKTNKNKKGPKDPFVCLCQGVTLSTIKEALTPQDNSISKLQEKTGAGMGACGGSCKPKLMKIINKYKNQNKIE